MAYFDNPERRAAWEKELSALRREKEARKSGIPTPTADIANEYYDELAPVEMSGPLREKISYAELLMEEKMVTAAKASKTAPQRELKKEVQLER